jgi:phosphoadenosine phosphosulfate reductase
MRSINLQDANASLQERSAADIARWALDLGGDRAIVSTHFGPMEAVILHLCASIRPTVQVVWVDSGYNTASTYQFAQALTARLGLRVATFAPARTRAYRDAVLGGIPDLDDAEAMRAFTEEVKLEPFRRALASLQPTVWLTALRREQTAFRQGLEVVTQDPGGPLKVCPLLDWTDADMRAYLAAHDLPDEPNYYDPTKVLAHRECGLHPSLFKGDGEPQG